MNVFPILPPLIVLITAILTRRVLLSLSLGLFSSAFIACNFQLVPTFEKILMALLNTLNYQGFVSGNVTGGNTGLFAFIIAMGVVIIVLVRSGATLAFTKKIQSRLKTRKDVEKTSLVLSTIFFIDDYFSSLSMGTLMQPLTDTFKISRAKLAFLIDSMACPVAILCPFSSWVGVIVGFLSNSGIHQNLEEGTIIQGSPFYTFLELLPFIFYSFLIMGAAWYIVIRDIKFGKMAAFEHKAITKGQLGGNINSARSSLSSSSQATIHDFFIIWGFLILSLVFSLLYYGDWSGLGGANNLLKALQYTDVNKALFMCSCAIAFACPLYLLHQKHLQKKQLYTLPQEGVTLMKGALMILLIAWSMGDILREDLGIGQYIATQILNHVSYETLPLAVFITATMIAFATGSSWGTAALLFPMIIPTIAAQYQGLGTPSIEDLTLFFPTIGALLSGCVAGDHISPISDTTIMTATSTDMPHLDHVRTQFGYAFPVIIGTGFGFLLFPYIMLEAPLYLRAFGSIAVSYVFVVTYIELRNFLETSKKPQVSKA